MFTLFILGMALAAIVVAVLKRTSSDASLFVEKSIETPWTYTLCAMLAAAITLVLISVPLHFLLAFAQAGYATPLQPGVYRGPIFLMGDVPTFATFVMCLGLPGVAVAASIDASLKMFKLAKKRWLVNLGVVSALPVLQFAYLMCEAILRKVRVLADLLDPTMGSMALSFILLFILGAGLLVLFIYLFEKYRPSTTMTGTISGVATVLMFALPFIALSFYIDMPMLAAYLIKSAI